MPLWELKVNENLAASLIRTKIKLEETLNNDEAFTIEFNTIYPLPSNIPPNGTFPDYDNIDEQGSYYPPNGPNPPPVPNGGEPAGGREGILAFWAPASKRMVFNAKIETAGMWYKDDTGMAADDINPNIQGMKFDFVTTALHEWGHMLGLDHPDPLMPGPVPVPANNIMTGAAQGKRAMGIPVGILRSIDADGALAVGGSVAGAKNLYTIPARGDLNCDNLVDLLDVPPFVSEVLGLGGFCNPNRADTNCDGLRNGRDIPGMIDAILAIPPM